MSVKAVKKLRKLKDEVDKLRIKMVEKGFNGAFVIAFKDGIRINVKEALSLQK